MNVQPVTDLSLPNAPAPVPPRRPRWEYLGSAGSIGEKNLRRDREDPGDSRQPRWARDQRPRRRVAEPYVSASIGTRDVGSRATTGVAARLWVSV
jgi:hypothetical protein